MDGNTHLDKAIQSIVNRGSQLKRCLESEGRLLAAIKHALVMLQELKTSNCSPKQYYELYVACFDRLNPLREYLVDASGSHNLNDVYEIVQYTSAIVPRLYLMITVGSAYCATPGAPIKSVLRDMLEMCRGVQQPLRGLFLRYYLGQMTREYLQLQGTGIEGLEDAIRFTVVNFIEMNKLWVRLQYSGHSSESARRWGERKELQTIVGANLVRLSQLDGLTADIFRSRVLPAILQQIVHSRDSLAQEYLMDVLCQAFDPAFHVETLDLFLGSLASMVTETSVYRIFSLSLERVNGYIQEKRLEQAANKLKIEDQSLKTEEGEAPASAQNEETPATPASTSGESGDKNSSKENAIKEESCAEDLSFILIMYKQRLEQISNRLKSAEKASILASLCRLSLVIEPKDQVHVGEYLADIEKICPDPSPAVAQLLSWLLDRISFAILAGYPSFDRLVLAQSPEDQSKLTSKVFNSVNAGQTRDLPLIKRVFELFSKAARTNQSGSCNSLVQLIHTSDYDNLTEGLDLLRVAQKVLREGGAGAVQETYPSLVSAALRLAPNNPDENLIPVFRFVNKVINDLTAVGQEYEKGLYFYLLSASSADRCNSENEAYEFFVKAFSIYEEAISNSHAQNQAVYLMISSLQQTVNFSPENYDTLASKITMYGQRLLRKSDQCRAVYSCAHLWQNHDDDRLLKTLQHASRIADGSMDIATTVTLFVELLDRYLYFLEGELGGVSSEQVNGIIKLIKETLSESDDQELEVARGYFERTVHYIKMQQNDNPIYDDVEC